MQISSPKSCGIRFSQVLPFAAVLLIIGCVAWFFIANIYPHIRHRRISDQMQTAIFRLSLYRPSGLTEDQWAFCIVWTHLLHGNYGGDPYYVPTDDLKRILKGTQQRINSGPDLATIDWIWDQYERSCPEIVDAYEHNRPTAPHRADEFKAGAHGGNPLSWFCARYQQRVGENALSR